MQQYKLTILASSSAINGAYNISPNGDSFQLNFSRPIIMPKEAINISIRSTFASIWYVTPNIHTGINDKMYFSYLGTPYNITIAEGLYSLYDLSESINIEINKLALPSLISLTGISATQQTVINYNNNGVRIDFTQPQTFASLLGFDSYIYPNNGSPSYTPHDSVVGETSISDNKAALNNINYYLVHSDIVSYGIYQGGTYNQTIMQVPIDVEPGSLIIYTPYNPDVIPANDLAGQLKNGARFWLTDQNNNPVETLGEEWSIKLEIVYWLPNELQNKCL